MRTAVGVILIIAAVLNLVASLGYFAGGAATTALSQAAIYAEQEITGLTTEEKESFNKVQSDVEGAGIGLMA
ncbi:MAG: hypothetical protein JKX98_00370 [Alcanivoracaceae bacterium]|nr:hypothetical protein [Alcanivoracaceae bacterium]